MIGRVTSTKLKNTATVLVERVAYHPLYKKTFLRTKKYLVDDLIGVKEGDLVEIVKCKPVSRNKHFKITKVVGKDLAEIVEAEQKMAAEKIVAEVMPASPEGGQGGPEEKKSEQGTVESEQSEKETTNKIKKIKKGGKE